MRRALPLILAAALLLGACAGSAPQAQPRTLSVNGSGTVHVEPDIALISLGVQTLGPDVGVAVQENNRRAKAVMQALLETGVAPADMRTTNFYVSSQPQFDPMGVPTGETNYTVDNTIFFTLRAPDKLGSVLQSALQAGSNSVQSVSYSIADPSLPMAEARQLAVADAQRQAEELASAAGAALGDVLFLSEGGASIPIYYEAPAFGKGGGGGGVPVESGTLAYQAQISLTYTLK